MSLLLLLKNAVAAPPVTPVATVNPVPTIEIDFLGNPSATFGDVHKTADGSVSFWRMNSATTFLDEHLTNPGVVLGTPSTISSPFPYDTDQGLSFNGTTDSAYVLSSPTLTTKSQFSIDGWVKVASLPGSTVDLACKQGSWRLRLTSAGKLVWTLKDDTSTVTLTSNSVLSVNTWYYVACVYDDTQVLLYVNGVLDNSVAYSSGMGLEGQPIRFAGSTATTAPTWQSVTTASGNSSSITGSKPASSAAGDVLIAHMGWYTGMPPITSVPAGWVPLAQDDGTMANTQARIYAKVLTGSEPASYLWTIAAAARWSIAISRFTGVDSITPWGRTFATTDAGSGTAAHKTGSHLASTENCMIVALFLSRTAATFTIDSGTERYDFADIVALAASTQTQASPSALEVTGTASVSNQGTSFWLVLNGTGVNETACSLDDWTYWNKALTVSEVQRNYNSKDSGVGTWTNVSTSTRSIDLKVASRQYELDQMEAGTFGVVLKDESRSFDPANTSSPYYPNVVPVRKIRGRTTYQGTVYDLFYGYIERWPPQNAVVSYQEIALTAVDGFDALALADVSGTLEIGYSGTQINTLLDKALWPKDARAIEQGQYVMAAQTLTNQAALGAIQDLAASERGIFFIDQSGVAVFHDSAHRGSFPRSTATQVTFTDSHTSYGVFYQDLKPSFDKDRIVNHWEVSPDSSVFASATQQQEDAAAIAKYWRRSGSRSTRLVSNADALAQAGNLLNETANPGQRFDSLVVKPTTTAAYQACLGLEISDRVTVIRGLVQGWDGTVLTKDCFVEAIDVTAVGGEPWTFTFSLSPCSLGNYRDTIVRDGPVSFWRMDTLA